MCDNDNQLLSVFFDEPLMKEEAKYLRLPTSWGRLKSEAYSFIVEKTLGVLQGWTQKRMSMGGNEIMIMSYAMLCFLLPKRLCDKLNSYVSNFWWKGDAETRGIHWCSWNKMTMAKSDGGMGFRNFLSMNEALLARQGWRLL